MVFPHLCVELGSRSTYTPFCHLIKLCTSWCCHITCLSLTQTLYSRMNRSGRPRRSWCCQISCLSLTQTPKSNRYTSLWLCKASFVGGALVKVMCDVGSAYLAARWVVCSWHPRTESRSAPQRGCFAVHDCSWSSAGASRSLSVGLASDVRPC